MSPATKAGPARGGPGPDGGSISASPAAAPRRRRGDAWYPWLGPIGVIGVLALWEAVVRIGGIEPLFLPSASDTFAALVSYASSGLLAVDAAVSAQEFGLGFAIALVVGVLVGFAMGATRILNGLTQPLVAAGMAVPYIALFPILIVWFGIGLTSKVVIVFIAGVFPILVNTAAGVQSVDRELVRMAQGFSAGRLRILATIAAPGAVPFIVSGVRLALARGLIAVIVGELLAAQAGLGYRIAQAGARFDTAQVFAGIAVISAAAILINVGISRVERHFQKWKVSD